MRRGKRLGIYSNGTIKRCYGKGCCEQDPARLAEWWFPKDFPEENKQNWLKAKFHQHFLGHHLCGKGKVPFHAKTHRMSKHLRNFHIWGALPSSENKIYIKNDINHAKLLFEFEEYLKLHDHTELN